MPAKVSAPGAPALGAKVLHERRVAAPAEALVGLEVHHGETRHGREETAAGGALAPARLADAVAMERHPARRHR
jgi:hypothetical protein